MNKKPTDGLGIQVPEQWIELPEKVHVDFGYWEFLDEVGAWFLQGAAVVAGGPYVATPDVLTGTINIASSSGIEIFFPMWGTRITVSNGSSFDIPSGDHVVLVKDIEYPVTNQSKDLSVVAAGDGVHDQGQYAIYLGGRVGDSVYMRPDTKL